MTYQELKKGVKHGTIKIELGGHTTKFSGYYEETPREHFLSYFRFFDNGTFNNEMYGRQVNIGQTLFWMSIIGDSQCETCGEVLCYVLKDEKTLILGKFGKDTWVENEVCAKPCTDGLPTYGGHINIKSKMVIANLFRTKKQNIPKFQDEPEKPKRYSDYTLCSHFGRANVCNFKQKQNIAFGQMSNTDLGVYLRKDKQKIILAYPYWKDVWIEENWDNSKGGDMKDQNIPPHPMHSKMRMYDYIGDIDLCVWRWEAGDLDEIKPLNPTCFSDNHMDVHILDVKQGKWKFEHFYDAGKKAPNWGNIEVYTTLEYVNE
jgi:hypothetical protein